MLKTFGFEKNLVRWIKIQNQESYITIGGITTKYFRLERGTRQGDSVSAYLFTLALKVVFANQNIDKLRILKHVFLYTAYADDTTFFVKNQTSVIEILKVFDNFSKISGLKSNKSKCEIAGIGALKGSRVAHSDMQYINLNKQTVKILGIHFSYNKKLEEEKNFNNDIAKTKSIFKVRAMRDLTTEGKVVIFKSLAILKVVYLPLIKTVLIFTVE